MEFQPNQYHLPQTKFDNDETKSSVRRLSLFDSIEEAKTSDSSRDMIKEKKSEPVFDNNQLQEESTISETGTNESGFEPEEMEIEEDFNQESEEELLDIPTFLRRQAN